MDTVLRAIDLTKSYGSRVVVNGLNFEVHRGEIYGFLGPNGAGKSTTIRMMLSLVKPGFGDVEIFGKAVSRYRNKTLWNVGALVESADFYQYLSAERNLEILGRMHGTVSPVRIDEVLEIVRLRDRKRDRVKNFSHGMKQRLGIAQALLSEPDLIILDEPTTGLDPQGMKEVRDLIKQLSEDHHTTIFLSSHLLHEVEQICTHMGIINFGELVIQGSVSDLVSESRLMVTEFHIDHPARAAEQMKEIEWIEGCDVDGEILRVRFTGQKRPELIRYLVNNGFRISAVIPRTSLEDYFLSLTSDQEG